MASGGGVVTNEVLFSRATRENVHKPTRGFITTKASFAKPRGSVHSFDFQEHLHTFKFCEKVCFAIRSIVLVPENNTPNLCLFVFQNIPKFQKSTRAYMRQIIALQDSMIRYLVSVLRVEKKTFKIISAFFVVRFTNELNLLIDEETSHEGRMQQQTTLCIFNIWPWSKVQTLTYLCARVCVCACVQQIKRQSWRCIRTCRLY